MAHDQPDADFVQVRPHRLPAFIMPHLQLGGPMRLRAEGSAERRATSRARIIVDSNKKATAHFHPGRQHSVRPTTAPWFAWTGRPAKNNIGNGWERLATRRQSPATATSS